MRQYWKKIEKVLAIGLLVFGLLTPLLLFVNRVLEPDVSCDSLNYHLYLGFKGWNPGNDKYEFFPTGIHNFSPVLETVGYGFYRVLGYRIGTIFSIVAIYLSILAIYKIFRLIFPDKNIRGNLLNTFLLVSSFLSFELFLGIATYYNDVLVALLTVWGVYFLLKYFSEEKFLDLVISAVIISVSVWGKQTNLYIAIALGMTLLVDLIMSKGDKNIKMRNLVLAGIILLSLPGWWYIRNWQETRNPVFPFYNAFFKSEYYSPVSFHEPQFGGENLGQKLMWGYYSIFDPARLGQVHDLFHDFKINFYFIFGGLISLFYLVKKELHDKLTTRLLVFYWLSYLIWSIQFGYLRYALALEFLGGLLILIMFNKKLGRYKFFLFVPACLWLLVQNKRVINLSLAYDVSFRPGYFYNRLSYPKSLPNLFNSQIKLKNNNSADIYLNCSFAGMSYYVVSPFNNLPVVNIDQTAYSQMTNNQKYIAEQKSKLMLKIGDKKEITFVTIGAKTGLNTEYKSCVTNLQNRGWVIYNEEEIDFLGYSGQKLGVIWGTIPMSLFSKDIK